MLHDLWGNRNDRNRRESWLEKQLCQDCARQKGIEQSKSAAAEAEARSGKTWILPELTGSTRQITWANDLRMQVVGALDKLLGEIFDGLQYLGAHPMIQGELDRLTRAEFWINCRHAHGLERALLLAAVSRALDADPTVPIEYDRATLIVWCKGLPIPYTRLIADGAFDMAAELVGEGKFQDFRDRCKLAAKRVPS